MDVNRPPEKLPEGWWDQEAWAESWKEYAERLEAENALLRRKVMELVQELEQKEE